MSSDLFLRSAAELDALLDAARPDLARRGISVADGSAREVEVWAFSFNTEREIGLQRQRIATTLTLRGDVVLMLQSIATGPRVQHRGQSQVSWPELRRRGMAAIVEDALASAQYHLQVKLGADFAHEEFIRRCESILDLIGDDLPNAPALREQVTTWKSLAEQRSLYSAVRRKLIDNLNFGHLQNDALVLEEFYEANIYGPLSARPPAQLTMRGDTAPVTEPDRALPRRVSILDRIPKAPPPEPESTKPMLVVGILLAVIALGLLAFGIVRHTWPLIAGSAIFLLFVLRALRQWHG
jgi:hypothetical protein